MSIVFGSEAANELAKKIRKAEREAAEREKHGERQGLLDRRAMLKSEIDFTEGELNRLYMELDEVETQLNKLGPAPEQVDRDRLQRLVDGRGLPGEAT